MGEKVSEMTLATAVNPADLTMIVQGGVSKQVTISEVIALVPTVMPLPSGSVTAYAGESIPAGWLECNGGVISRTTYPTLFSAIGTIFGIGDGSTTFSLPDLRGQFIRGFDNGAEVDPARYFGTKQGDIFGAHAHSINTGANFSVQAGSDNGGAQSLSITGYGTGRQVDATIGTSGGSETRPKNIALFYIIKT